MKLKYIVKVFVITCLIFGITNSFAENKIVYIDINKILKESKVGIYVEKELTTIHETKLNNFTKIEEKLKIEEIDLVSKKNIMARDEFNKKVKLWTEESRKHQIVRRKWFDQITEKRNNARAEVLKSLDPIITEYFKQNQISILLFKRNIAIGTSDLDITDTIIDEIEKKLPSIKMN
jgi:Skp family chaperone for outer membrane proteins